VRKCIGISNAPPELGRFSDAHFLPISTGFVLPIMQIPYDIMPNGVRFLTDWPTHDRACALSMRGPSLCQNLMRHISCREQFTVYDISKGTMFQ
jgi:hypothetical protein